MANIWFTADFHLNHSNILRYCNRPFPNVEEMNQGILGQINRWVKTNDILYFLGDFCMGSKARAVEFRRQIHCKTIFALPGNHDKQVRKLTQDFRWLDNLSEISISRQRIVLCHYAMRVWNHSSHEARSAHALGAHDSTPTTPSITSNYKRFQQIGESAFRSKITRID